MNRFLLPELIDDLQSGIACGERANSGVIQLRMNNVLTNGEMDFREYIRIPKNYLNEEMLLREGDVLFNNTNSVELVGKTALFPGFREDVTFSNHFFRIRTKRNLLAPEYLAYWLQYLWSSDYFESICDRWVGQAAVQRRKLDLIEIPLPNVHIQNQIASELKSQLAEVETARNQIESQISNIAAMRSLVFRETFNNVVPVAEPKSLDEAPSGWHWHRLTDISRLESGHTPSRARPDWWGGDISWVSLTEIRSLDGQWVESTQIKTNQEGIANSSARILPRGTVCFSRTASVGFVTILATPMATSQDFANWVCGDELDPEYLMYALMRSRTELRGIATGATHKTIYMPSLESFHVCAPERAEQERIVSLLKSKLNLIEQAHEALQKQYADIKLLPQKLLSSMFS